MQKTPEERIHLILQKSANSGLTSTHFTSLDIVKEIKKNQNWFRLNTGKIVVFIVVLTAACVLNEVNLFYDPQCYLTMPSDASKIFREPENCDICETVSSVEKIKNISQLDFHTNYAQTAKPVVISDGALTWPALKSFSFEFFKKLYATTRRDQRNTCQFFPYKTEFNSLQSVFNMNSARAKLQSGEKPWYIGWSNCNDEAGKILQQYYERPYFLSNHSENIALSWIFMGGPGNGAHMHVDNVRYPSWQAQLSGRKLWRLAPPPECLYKCVEIEITVEPGEIIVLDTNRWYHQTFILPGDISITIGSEFD